MTVRPRLRAGFAIALIAVAAPATAAGAVRPDPGFGGRGFVTTSIRGANSGAYGVTVLPGGKVVVVGRAIGRSGTSQIVVARYRQGGRLDRSFGTRGVFRTGLPKRAGPFVAIAVGLQRSTGRLVVAGGYGMGSMLALRLTKAGRLDRTFGQGRSGLARVQVGGIAQSIAFQPGGRILLGGSNANRNGRPMVVARLGRNGALDRGFGTGGRATSIFWNADLAASAGVTGLASTGGGIIGSGHLDYIGSDGHGSAGVFRLDANGRPDSGFGSGGGVEVAFSEPGGTFAQWFPCAMVVDSLGRITVTGDGTVGATRSLLTIRLTSTGASDSSFGAAADGRAVTSGLANGEETTCGAALGAGGTLTAGLGTDLVGLAPNGTPNDALAPNGVRRITRPRGVTVNAVATSGPRRVVVAGAAGRSLYAARYLLPRP